MELQQRLTFFDVETGGLNPKRHPIIQIAAIQVDRRFENWRTFERKIKFDPARAERDALAMNSYDPAVWEREAVSAESAAKAFKKFISQAADVTKYSKAGRPYKVAQLAAHNAPFDRDFLFAWFRRENIFLSADWHVIDTVQLALLHNTLSGQQPSSLKLGDLCAYYGIPLENAHDALGDVTATVKLAHFLLTQLKG